MADICPHCSMEDIVIKQVYDHCFYCVLTGKCAFPLISSALANGIELNGNVINQAYRIGYNDGYNRKDLPNINCSIRAIGTIYSDGYQAGKKIKELETELKERTVSFCALLPDFLAKIE